MLNLEKFEQVKSDFKKAEENTEFFDYDKTKLQSGPSALCVMFLIALIVFLFFLFMLRFAAGISGVVFFLWCGICLIGFPFASSCDNSDKKEIDDFSQMVFEHNKNVFYNKCEYKINEIGKVSKLITCKKSKDKYENIVIYDDINQLLYFDGIYNQFNSTIHINMNQCSYRDIIKYELIDETTSQLIASSSVTSSNAGKAIGGAIATGLLFGNATVGAVIGAGGKQTTQTEYKTETKESYTLNIFINRLENSIIKIHTSNRQIITEIISVVEYIINKNV